MPPKSSPSFPDSPHLDTWGRRNRKLADWQCYWCSVRGNEPHAPDCPFAPLSKYRRAK